jgi:hypothetical protein
LANGGAILGRLLAVAAADLRPPLERRRRRRGRDARLPAGDAELRRQFPRRRNQPEAFRRALDLARGSDLDILPDEVVDRVADAPASLSPSKQQFDELRPGDAVTLRRGLRERLDQLAHLSGRPGIVKCPEVQPAIRGDVEQAQRRAPYRPWRRASESSWSRPSFRPTT